MIRRRSERALGALRGGLRWPRRLAAASMVAGCIGCIDTTPVIVLDEDGGTPVPDSASIFEACMRCLNAPDVPGPGCLDEISACRENSLCAAILVCASADGCFVVATREEEVRCGTRCADKVGVGSSTDPAILLGAQVDACARANCSKVCPAYAH